MATIPSPYTAVAGTKPTVAQHNTWKDSLLFLLGASFTGGRKPVARLRQTAAQTLATGTGAGVNFDTEDVDYDAGHSTTTNTSRYTAQTAGWYQVGGAVGFVGNATGSRLAWLAVNGTAVTGTAVGYGTVPNAGHVEITVPTTLVYLNVGDYVELYAYQTSGGNLNTYISTPVMPVMSVLWVSE